jgi:outer membrane autotransporter protein
VDTFAIANGGLLNMGHGVTATTGFGNDGTLSVAEAGNVTITGDYAQTANGTYQLGAASNTVYGKLNVTGTATLPAAAKIVVDVNGVNTLATGDTLAGVLTAGTLSASTFAVTDNSALFDFTGAVNGNAIDLAIAASSATGVVDAVTGTGSTSALGAAAVFDALIAAPPGGAMGAVITALGLLPTQQAVSDAVTGTLPLMTGSMARFALSNLHGIYHVVQAWQGRNSGLSSGDGFISDRYGWVKPIGSWADQDNRDGAFGYSAQTFGIVAGADGEISQASRLGAAFGYTRSAVDGNSGLQTADVDSYVAMLYGSRSLDERTELDMQADFGYNKNKGNRFVTLVSLNALSDYSSTSFHVGAGVSRSMEMSPKTTFVPSVRADYTTIRDQGYTETGAGALNLTVNGKSTDEFILALDGKVAHAVNDTSTVTANLGVGYDTQARQSSITSAFQGGGAAFTTTGINPSATLVRGGVGMVTNTSNAVEITARYDIEARSGFTNQTASVKLRMQF